MNLKKILLGNAIVLSTACAALKTTNQETEYKPAILCEYDKEQPDCLVVSENNRYLLDKHTLDIAYRTALVIEGFGKKEIPEKNSGFYRTLDKLLETAAEKSNSDRIDQLIMESICRNTLKVLGILEKYAQNKAQ